MLLAGCALTFASTGLTAADSSPKADASAQSPDIEVFVREGCPHCARAEAFLAKLQLEQPQLGITVRDVSKEPAALDRLKQISESLGFASARVPTFVVGGQLIVGFSDEANTAQLIRNSLAQARSQSRALPIVTSETFALDFFGHRLALDQVGLPVFTLAMGLIDGFNPCSMWVLILMISLLAPMKDRLRMIAVAGTFVAVEGIAYFIFMAAWLNLFLFVGLSRASEVIIAVLALAAGVINLKDFVAFGRGVSLSIPEAAKPGLYARMRGVLQAENLAGAIAGVVVLAVLVQIVEFMCTSGFPVLYTRILTLRHLDNVTYYGYLLLYDAAYMLDDVIVLAIGVVTLSQRRLQEREGQWLKLISGLVMIALGAYLLFIPH